MAYLIGTDPELFVTKGGILQSAFGLVKGDKKNPFVVNGGAVQVDGMALEFNTDPTDCENTFVSHISTVMAQLKAMVPEYEFFIEPTAEFGKDFIEQQPEEAKELGCDPDFNAYTKKANPKPDGDMGIRTASGHIHIGWTEGEDINDPFHFDECCAIAKQLDFFLGAPSLLYDGDEARRSMYGMAGSFRPKPYGMEYRVLSNAWLKTEELQRWVFSNAQLAIDTIVDGKDMFEEHGVWAKNVLEYGKDDERLVSWLEFYDIPLPPVSDEMRKVKVAKTVAKRREKLFGGDVPIKKSIFDIDELLGLIEKEDDVALEWRPMAANPEPQIINRGPPRGAGEAMPGLVWADLEPQMVRRPVEHVNPNPFPEVPPRANPGLPEGLRKLGGFFK